MILEDKYIVTTNNQRKILYSLSPSSKFILYLLKQRGPLNQKEILKKTLLPKRTVAYSLKTLQKHKFIKKYKKKGDLRKTFYEVIV